MSIIRQYSLPNCTLILEGMSDGGDPSFASTMNVLMNVQCVIGADRTITGGQMFFKSLVKSVSNYVQGFLSGVEHRHLHGANQDMVNIERLPNSHLHRLSISQVKEQSEHSIDLTTAQLFDLMEAIDQCLADTTTLPELTLKEKPLPRKYRRSTEPIAKRVGPPALGLVSIAIAAGLSLLLPTPTTVPNPNLKPGETTTESTENPDEVETGETPPGEPTIMDLDEINEALKTANKIEDPTELQFIQRYLKETINQAWDDRGQNAGERKFRVTATRDGSIVNFTGINGTGNDAAEQTPLPSLKYNATSKINTEAIADFLVVFDGQRLEISPWDGYKGAVGYGPTITDAETLGKLQETLADTLTPAWDGVTASPESLIFRVGVTEDGEIADFEPRNAGALGHKQDVPLEKLVNPAAAGIEPGKTLVPQKALGQFKVTFTTDGDIKVEPW